MLTTVLALTALAVAAAQTPTAPIRLNLTFVDDHATSDVARFQDSAIERPIEPRTAVEIRFAPDGLVGSAGYLCGVGGIGPDGDNARVGPASAFQHFGNFLGASLGYAFR